jgi:uncharacterized protein YkwD
MNSWSSSRTAVATVAAAAAVGCRALCFLLFIFPAVSQERPANRPPIATSPTGPPATPSAALPHVSQPSAEEKSLLDDANRERAAVGLQPFKWDDALAAAARQHAQVMASQNLLLHQCLNELPVDQRAAQAGAKFSMIAENIAVGPNPETIHDGWMHSIGHRKNILNPDITAIGVATVRASAGLFAVQDFSRPVEALSLEQQEDKVIALLKSNGLQIANVSEEARKACKLDRSLEGSPASYVIRFQVTELSRLPDDLFAKVKSRAFRKATVGACRGADVGSFTRYRIAVLLN